MAFLGYGASGSCLTLFENLKNKDPGKFLTTSSGLFALAILLCFLAANSIPFDFARLAWDKNQAFFILLYDLVLSLPFFFAGLTISFVTARFSQVIHKIYFSDLLGAGTGSFIAVLIFLPGGEKGVFLIISLLALTASFLFCPQRWLPARAFLIFILIGEGVLLIASPTWLNFRISPFKALPLALKYPQASHYLTQWNSISRVDVIRSPAVRYAPGLSLIYGDRLPSQVGLSVDGGELSAITQFQSSQEKSLEFLSALPSSCAYGIVPNPRTLIIEPKGGLDVLAALHFQAPQIKVIESNPLILHLMNNELASLSGRLYHQKNIQVLSAHPREALSNDSEIYDLIVFSMTDVFGASNAGLHGFHEDYLTTVESFSQFLARLSPRGIVSMTMYLLPPPRQELKILATWVEALEKDRKDPSSCLAAIRTWGTISYFIKKSPFQEPEVRKLKTFAHERLFDLVYYPGISPEEVNIYNVSEEPIYYNLTRQILSPQSRKELFKKYLFEIRPATDNRPFFSNVYKLGRIKDTYTALGKKWPPLLQGGLLVPLLLIQSVFIALIFILLPVLISSLRKTKKRRFSLKICLFFSLLGAGYMLVEVTLIQKLILFLGHPLYSAAAVIFSLLFSSGLGSLSSRRILGENFRKKIKWVLLIGVSLIPLYLALLPALNRNFIGLSLVWKVILTFLAIFPLGFFLGFPFPTGIRILESQEETLIPWAWASNAFSSVVTSALAAGIALWGGYNLALILASAGYLLSLSFLNFTSHRHEAHA